MITSYPKIFAIGTDYIRDIFDGPVEVTEKVDGSQFAFMKSGNDIYTRSKGAIIFPETSPKMFKKAVDYVHEISAKLPDGIVFYGEVLDSPRHNTLAYERVPKHNIVLFGALKLKTQAIVPVWQTYAEALDLEVVPLLYYGVVESTEQLKSLLAMKSFLGKSEIEGVVVKNYSKPFLLGGQPIPVMAGKYVREDFKEMNGKVWAVGVNRWKEFCESFKTEARWLKAIQHLRDEGKLTNEPKDIGPLLKEINCDILSEETETIKNFLFKEYKNEVLRAATRGLPEWYKDRLASKCFESST